MQKYTRLATKDDLAEIMAIIGDAKVFLKKSAARNGKMAIQMKNQF